MEIDEIAPLMQLPFRAQAGLSEITAGRFDAALVHLDAAAAIAERVGYDDVRSLGFQADVKTNKERHHQSIKNLEPEDLIHYGLIPEFVGRLPVIGTLDELDETALIKILTEPKNALVKQYQKKFEFDNISLKFTDGALTAIAHEAHKRKVGARGLMMILEEILLESMYILPSEKKVAEIVLTKEMIERKSPVFEVMTRNEEAA